MKNRGLFVGLVLLVLLAVGGAFWLLLQDDPLAPEPDGTAEVDGEQPGSTDEPGAEDETVDDGADEPSKRRKRPRVKPWVHRGDGSLVGELREYGTDEPIAGAKVSLRAATGGPESMEVVTDPGGRFSFDTVPAYDAWTLLAKAPEPLADSELAGLAVDSDAQTDLGVVYLTPGFLLHGSVVDSDGKAIVGASVQAVRARPAGSSMDLLKIIGNIPARPAAVDRATTDVKGEFALGKVPPGKYDFFVGAAGHQQRVRRGIVVTPDLDPDRLRFVLPDGYTLSGRVIREAAEGPEGLTVVAFPNPEGPAGFATLEEKLFATCDAEGGFTLDGLRPAKWIVTVTPPNAPTTMKSDVVVPGTDHLEILVKGDAWLEGKVTDDEDDGIENAEVMLIMEGSGSAPLFGTTLTDAEGRYRIDGLPVVRVQGLIVRASGYASYPEDANMMMGRGRSELEVVQGRNEKNIELTPGGTIRGTIVDDQSSDPVQGARVSLISQRAFFGGAKSATTDAQGKFELTGVSKGSGVLSVWKEGWNQDLDPMQAMGGMMGRGGGADTDPGEGTTIVLTEPGQVIERTLRIQRGLDLTGRVLDPSGKPVAGARVSIASGMPGGGRMAAMMGMFGAAEPRLTDSDGRFVLPGAKPGTPQFVEAEAPGYVVTRSDPVTVQAGEKAASIEIRLAVGGEISGTVTDAKGNGVGGAEVKHRAQRRPGPMGDVEFDMREPVYTNQSGGFTIPNVAPGTYDIDIEHAQFVDLERKGVEAAEGKVTQLDVELDRGKALGGTVTGPDDAPVPSARVVLTSPTGGVWERTQSGPDGRFDFAGLEAGQYQLQATVEGLVSGDSPLVAAGETDVKLRLEQSYEIAGVVRYPSGAPVARAQVTARSDATRDVNSGGGLGNPRPAGTGGQSVSTGSARTADDGTFRIQGLRAGTYSVDLAPGWGRADQRANVIKSTIEGVQAGATELRLEAREGLEVRGTVTMSDGSAAPQGWVNASPITEAGEGDPSRSHVNGAVTDGKIQITGLEAGRYRMFVSIGAQRVEVLADAGDTALRVEFGASGKVTGSVTRADGKSAANFRVRVFGPTGNAFAMVGEDGRYETAALSVGIYTVQIEHTADGVKWTAQQDAVDVSEGGTTTVDLTLQRAAE